MGHGLVREQNVAQLHDRVELLQEAGLFRLVRKLLAVLVVEGCDEGLFKADLPQLALHALVPREVLANATVQHESPALLLAVLAWARALRLVDCCALPTALVTDRALVRLDMLRLGGKREVRLIF